MASSGRRVVTLPSGRAVIVDQVAWPDRPWGPEAAGNAFIVARGKRGDSGALEVYRAGGVTALVLDHADAEALSAHLNANVAARAAVRAPPGFRSGWVPKGKA